MLPEDSIIIYLNGVGDCTWTMGAANQSAEQGPLLLLPPVGLIPSPPSCARRAALGVACKNAAGLLGWHEMMPGYLNMS